MGPNHVEIEIKLHVDDLNAIQQRLVANGAQLSAERVYERNIRYDNAAGTLAHSGDVLRLRMDTRARLTYKGQGTVLDGGLRARTELEITVSDFGIADQLLQALGYRSAWTYEKYRTTYTLSGCEV